MYPCFLPYHKLAHSAKLCSRKRLAITFSRFSSTLSPVVDVLRAPVASEGFQPSPQARLRERKYDELKNSLTRGGSPSRIWAYYTSLIDTLGYEKIPLEVHQEVLRRCTPSSAELRVSAARRLVVGNKPSNPHIHESRFQAIIRNIRAMDQQPDINDYHFILEQFAAVGHHIGAIQVYKEMIYTGITPRTKTYGLCLQAIAHRMTLPVEKRAQDYRIIQTRRMMADLITDMQKLEIPFTSANLDLTIRIMKETIDAETFENILKWGYGVDLSNPDRPPLEYSALGPTGSSSGMTEHLISRLPTPQPFSTSALNTTIEILGRFGNTSKIVQAFEVLTQPLPRANDHLFSSFDDDDDVGVADIPQDRTVLPPYTTPNTTSYNILIRHLSKAGETTLARHYINEAMLLELQTDQKLRSDIRNTHHGRKELHEHKSGFESVPAPRFAINRATLISVFGESNRHKNLNLMRWLSKKLNRILRRKRECLSYFTVFRQRMNRRKEKERNTQIYVERLRLARAARAKRKASESSIQGDAQLTPNEAESNSAFVPSLGHQRLPSVFTRNHLRNVSRETSVFDINLDEPQKPPAEEPVKSFDLDLHIRILERDVREVQTLSKHMEYVLGRTEQRLKERLGRRVWAGKDIYLTTDRTRRIVSREEWRKSVGFRPRKSDNPNHPIPLRRAVSPTSSPTFFQSNQTMMQGKTEEPSQSPSPVPAPTPFSSASRRR